MAGMADVEMKFMLLECAAVAPMAAQCGCIEPRARGPARLVLVQMRAIVGAAYS